MFALLCRFCAVADFSRVVGFNPLRRKDTCTAVQFAIAHDIPEHVVLELEEGSHRACRNGLYYTFATTMQECSGTNDWTEIPKCFLRLVRLTYPDRWVEQPGQRMFGQWVLNESYTN